MERIAFFVEGLSEQLFIEKLLTEILGQKNISIEKRKMKGGSKMSISIIKIGAPSISPTADYFFMIIDCSGETTIATYIRNQRDSLLSKGYSAIFGLLDVRPNWSRNEIPKLRKMLYYKLPQKDIETKFILSVMEIESWFLAEEKHFKNIHPDLDVETIKKRNNFDPLSNTELVDEPARLLHEIYQNVGFAYSKKKNKISRTIENLDYANLYIHVVDRNESLKDLLNSIQNVI